MIVHRVSSTIDKQLGLLLIRFVSMAPSITLLRAFMPNAAYLVAPVEEPYAAPQPTVHMPECISGAFGTSPPTEEEKLFTNGCLMQAKALCGGVAGEDVANIVRGGAIQGIFTSGNAVAMHHCCPQARCGDAYGSTTQNDWRRGCMPKTDVVREHVSSAMMD
jgi:hypothetical protein